ncbi:MAG: sigma-70 family RNA polymerase sigma factor [Acidobacteria bacterium]|nr:sigma-70 family RNA polymerase sigma factor [Acidobacteriota bacterium]
MTEADAGYSEDRLLVQRLLEGEEAAFDSLADRHFGALYRFALSRIGGDEDLAAELVQNTLTTAFRKLESYRGESALLTWMCGICQFEIRSHLRRKRRAPAEVELTDQTEPAAGVREGLFSLPSGPADELEQKEVAHMVHRVLDELPGHYGQALEWKYIDGLPVKEIALRLGLGAKAAESILTRARVAFQKAYSALLSAPLGERVLAWPGRSRSGWREPS